MKVNCETLGTTRLVVVDGQVDMNTSPELRGSLKTALQERPSTIVMDLSSVGFIDSSGLATLIEALQAVGQYGGKLRLCALTPEVRRLFDLAQLCSIFDLRETRAEALAE